MEIIVFDTETFGLIDSILHPVAQLEKWPKIKQISWQIFSKENKLTSTKNYFLEADDINKKNVLKEFLLDFHRAKLAIAHNYIFDFKVISAELIRHNLPLKDLELKPVYDTMLQNVDYCALVSDCGYYKYPTLTELYKKIYNSEFDNPHDSLNDVKATAACFWNLRLNNEIDFKTFPVFKEVLQLEIEKLHEDLNMFYGSRIKLYELVFKGCKEGFIELYLNEFRKKSRLPKNKERNMYNILEQPEKCISWTKELERVFLNNMDNLKVFIQYGNYLTLKETMEFLKSRNSYFPASSMKVDEIIALTVISEPGYDALNRTKTLEVYDIIQNMISEYERLKKEVEPNINQIKDNKGCLTSFIVIIGFAILKYFA